MFHYELAFSVRLDKVIPQVGELFDSLNSMLATHGVTERLGLRSEGIKMTVESPRRLVRKEKLQLITASLSALQERLPEFDIRFESMRCQSRKSRSESQSR